MTGSIEVTRDGNLLTSEEAATLTNQSRLGMTCLNGYFQDLYTTSLAKAMLLAPGGGAVAVWASSGLTAPEDQAPVDATMFNSLFSKTGRLGDAVQKVEQTITDPDILHTWIFFGDPATKRMW